MTGQRSDSDSKNNDSAISRRDLLAGAAVVATSAIASSTLLATPAAAAPSAAFEPKPLPFDPAKLNGISEKLIVSHHNNNYAGAVKRLNSIQGKIKQLPPDAAPYQMGSLKREELIAMNSMILHELYFANLGGSGKVDGTVERLLSKHFGTVDDWEKEFRLTGQALAGGSGWVMLCFSPHDKRLFNVWSSDHTQNLAGGVPILIMDMYEHAYQMDYGADAKSYIDAFFKNANWEEVARRAADLHLS